MLLDGIDKVPLIGLVHARKDFCLIPHQMTAQPSASWKLSAISVPFCSVQTIKVSESRDTVSQQKTSNSDETVVG